MVATTTKTNKTTWTLDPAHTLVEFSAKHMMITTVKGRFHGVDATINLDEEDVTSSSVTATIDAATIDTGIEPRDNHLRSADFLDVENHPTITFQSKRVEGSLDGGLRVVGDLTIRGVTREVTLDVDFDGRGYGMKGEVVGFTAETAVNRKDFGLNWNVALETGGVLVGDKVKITIHAQAIRQDA
jgi:polyisoprenoid-binding protein YceI